MNLSNLESYQFFLSQNGRNAILSEIKKFKETYGKNWLNEFKKDFPDLVKIVDLIANHNANDAFLKLKELVAIEIENQYENFFARLAAKVAVNGFLDAHQKDVFKLHSDLKAEIDKPRF